MTNLNDAFMEALEDYSGAVNDRRKARLLEYLGQTEGQINDMEFKALGDLGYRGALNDRWDAYLKALGGEGLSSLAQLMGSTFYGFSPRSLFLTGAQGAWYDPSDLSTLFTDTAGTISAAVGSAVALMLDKSRTTAFATRKNLLTDSEELGAASWLLIGKTVTPNAVSSPFAQSNAEQVFETATTTTHIIYRGPGRAGLVCFSAYVKNGPTAPSYLGIRFWSGATNWVVGFYDLTLGTTEVRIGGGAGGTYSGTTSSMTNEGDGWWRISLVSTCASGAANIGVFTSPSVTTSNDLGVISYLGSTLRSYYISAVQDEISSFPTSYQAVGASLPVSWPGNHATQSVLAQRPILSRVPATGRRNLLVATDTMGTQNVTVAAAQHTLSFTGIGTVTLSGASTAGPLVGTGVNNRVSLTFTPSAGTLTLTVTGSVTLAQLELGSSATAYQRVVTDRDVTEAGQPDLYYLFCDGIDDGMVTSAIDFTATDAVTVFAGLRKISDSGIQATVGLSNNPGATNGTFEQYFNLSTTTTTFISRGTSNATSQVAINAAPFSLVFTGLADISADSNVTRINGAQVATSASDQGAGNYANQPVYLFRRGGTTLPFNGWFFGGVILGRTATADEIANTEKWLNSKTRAY